MRLDSTIAPRWYIHPHQCLLTCSKYHPPHQQLAMQLLPLVFPFTSGGRLDDMLCVAGSSSLTKVAIIEGTISVPENTS